MKKLNAKQLLSVSLTLFAIFFGAGNMIFPPAMGQLAGTNFVSALAGFILTDAGIAILGMIAVVLVGSSMSDLGSLVSKKLAVFLSVGIYLLIGPLFALPRTGSASFELALLPYNPQEYTWVFSLLFTGCFFALTQWAKASLPLYSLGLGWMLPALLGVCVGLLSMVTIRSVLYGKT